MDLIHATSVNWQGRGILFTGPSGSGKSSLALGLMAFGAGLISDDQTHLQRDGEVILLHPAPNLKGMIEARCVGVLAAQPASPAPLMLVVDMGTLETDRLPPERHATILGHSIKKVRASASPYFLHALVHYLRAGRKH